MANDSHGALIANVLRLTEERALSVNQLAKLARVSQSYLSAVLRGESNPTLRLVDKVADAFGIPAADLIRVRD